jgi:hypothetical protein
MDALFAYTVNGAKQLGLDGETGSITSGRSADFVILDRDIIKCTTDELMSTVVLKTYFRGTLVYDKSQFVSPA